ncbi:MAG: acetyl ornithine aminotransferase family protein [Candidatus Hadarchaeales archaeon]
MRKRPRVLTEIPGPKARKIIERDQKVISPSCTREDPIVWERGEGCYLIDVDGNTFLDLSSGMFVLNYGYSHPEIVEAVRTQAGMLGHVPGTDFYHPLQVELAEKLTSIMPGNFEKSVFFCNSGTEAVEAAFKCARWHTGRAGIISFTGAFHGRTMGALSLTGSNFVHRERFSPLVPGVHFAPFAYCYRCAFGQSYPGCDFLCVEYLRRSLRTTIPPTEVGAVITEPIQGTSGYIVPPPEFFPMIAELCREHGWLFISDEVQTGLGRSGKMLAIEHWGVIPDIVCLAKALSGGMVPIGAIVARKEVMDWKKGAHANTFGGNALACAAALAGLKILERERLTERAAELGSKALRRMEEWKKYEIVGDVRGKGLLLAIEFVKDQKTKKPAPEERDLVVRKGLEKGILVFRGGNSTIRIAPPLIIEEEELSLGLDLLEEAVAEVQRTC